MHILQKILSVTIVVCCYNCFEHLSSIKETLYNEIVDYFFPKELQTPHFEMDRYLCRHSLVSEKCCSCSRICKYFGTCCMDTFFDNNITSVLEYVDAFFNLTSIRNYVKTLPVVDTANMPVKFYIQQYPMVSSCDRQSIYADFCNGGTSVNDVRVIADGFLYKNRYCALCHGFQTYSCITLEFLSCKHLINNETTVPDETCNLYASKNDTASYKTEDIMAYRFFPKADKLNCSKEDLNLCLNSYFALAMAGKGWYSDSYCALCHGLKNLTNEMCQIMFLFPDFIDKPPHFKLLKSFDEGRKSNSELVTGKPICPSN